MEKTIISFDWAIKGILRDKANFDVLSGFLSELLKREIEVLEVLESESNPDGPEGKTNRLDLKAKISGGEIAIFEIQTSEQYDFYHRIMYGAAKAVTEQISKGQPYENIKKVYSVDIINFELGTGIDYLYHGSTEFIGLHKRDTLLIDKNERGYFPGASAGTIFPEYYLIYPYRFDEVIKDKFDEWVYTLKTAKVKAEFTAAGLQEAGEKLAEWRMTADERIRYEIQQKYDRVRNSEIVTAENKGEKRGRAEGRAEEHQVWQGVVAEKESVIADKDAALAKALANNADKETALAAAMAEIEKLRGNGGGTQ